MRPPETRYARNGEAAIAYQVLGQGALDLVYIPSFISNLEIQWEDPGFGQFVKRLSRFTRLILIEPRGTGLSERGFPGGGDPQALAVDDLRAVADATGSGRLALCGAFDGADTALAFAARFPARTRALIEYAPASPSGVALLVRSVGSAWGRGDTAALLAPDQALDARFKAWWARFERLCASPGEARAMLDRLAPSALPPQPLPPAIPVLHLRRGGDILSADAALSLPGQEARRIELEGRDHLAWSGDIDRLADRVEEFLTGAAPASGRDRTLAALLVVRLVDPDRLLRKLGEERWRDCLERFDQQAREAVIRHDGRAAPALPGSLHARFDSPSVAAQCSVALFDIATTLALPVAMGLHVGEVESRGEILAGLTLRLAEQLAALALPGQLLASRVAADLASGTGLHFVEGPAPTPGDDGLPPQLYLLATEQHLEPARRPEREPDLGSLSAREREVLKLVAAGMSNLAIAGQLRLSEHTVKRHVANILMKLDQPTRAAAAVLAEKLPA